MPYVALSTQKQKMQGQDVVGGESKRIELGGVRSEYRKKNRILFQDQVFGNDVSFNDTLLSLDSSLD